jgi:hypothetical protein
MANKGGGAKRTGNTALLQLFIAPRDKQALQAVAYANNTTVSAILRQQIRSYLSKITVQNEDYDKAA